MTQPTPPGHNRAGTPSPGKQGNGVRSDGYSSPHASEMPDDINAYDQALVTSPGHGAVGVFQAPQPVRPRGGPAAVDPSLDIDSPFLDLFGATAAPVREPVPPPAPEVGRPAEDDFDFGFDFDDPETPPAATPAPVNAPPTAPAPVNGVPAAPAVREPSAGSGPASPV